MSIFGNITASECQGTEKFPRSRTILPGHLATVFAPCQPTHRSSRRELKIQNKKEKPKKWYRTAEHQQTFEEIKRIVSEKVILHT